MSSIEEIKERLRNKDRLEAELAAQSSRPSMLTTLVIFALVGGGAYNYFKTSDRRSNASKTIALYSEVDPALAAAPIESAAPVNTVQITAENVQAVIPELQKIEVSPTIDKIPTGADLEETGLLILPEGAKQDETQYRLITRLPAGYRLESSQFPDLAK